MRIYFNQMGKSQPEISGNELFEMEKLELCTK